MSADERIERLLDTALYDQGGESVEGAFVDHWEYNAQLAARELADAFRDRGFRAEDEARIRAALIRADVRPAEARWLFGELQHLLRPLAEELLEHPDPAVRSLLARAADRVVSRDRWLRLLNDPAPEVRLALVEGLSAAAYAVPDANPRLLNALRDPDPGVRAAAARGLRFTREDAAGPALAGAIREEPDAETRSALIAAAAEKVRTAGVHAGGQRLRDWVGEPLIETLLAELDHPAPEIRTKVIEALSRFLGVEVARALLERLRVETARDPRVALARFQGYHQVAEDAFPLLLHLLEHDPDATLRYLAAFLLESFGPAAEAPLARALNGSSQRAAAMSLAKVGSARVLPALIHAWSNPETPHWLWDREMESVVTDVTIRAAHDDPPTPPADLPERVERLLRALTPSGWVEQEMRDDHHALVLHGSQIYAWGLRPDGAILCMDHESFRHETEPESDPLTRFAVLVAGAQRFPELGEAIPQPPKDARPCAQCRATGMDPRHGSACTRCAGLGYLRRR